MKRRKALLAIQVLQNFQQHQVHSLSRHVWGLVGAVIEERLPAPSRAFEQSGPSSADNHMLAKGD
jgi:hypothetical protein